MAYVLIEDFKAGLDRRRMLETSEPGTLYICENAHITRGGEIEKRKAFVEKYVLPEGDTFGMAVAAGQLYVFGHGTTPGGMPAGIVYQQLAHPTAEEMVAMLSFDVFDGKIYVAAQFADGSIFHYFDGTRVDDWFDGKARFSFDVEASTEQSAVAATGTISVTGGAGAVAATGTIEVTAGTLSAGVNKINTVTVNGVDVLGAAVDHTGNNSTTATAIAAQINTYTSSPNYTATALGAVVTISALPAAGAGPNGFVVGSTVAGDAVLANAVNMSGGSAADTITAVTVDGVDVLGATVNHTGNNGTTATAVAAQITSYTSSPNYSASAVGATITITALSSAGSAPNGFGIAGTATGSASLSTGTMAGGQYTAQLTSITVNAVEVLGANVLYNDDPETTAAAVANQINTYVSSPNYTATANGATVNVIYPTSGTTANGYDVIITATAVNLSATTGDLAGGATTTDTFEPGDFVKTIKKKMYSTSLSLMHFSEVNNPIEWNGGGAGAGFVNMSNEASGSEQLVAIENYYTNAAIFSRRNVQIWFLDVDEGSNVQLQVLNNTGALSSGSVSAFGDSDVFYLSQTGVRSLKARDSSNSAFVSDVGTAIDPLITDAIRTLSEDVVRSSKSVIDPVDGRYLLALGETIYVFSYFPSSKISAWSTYMPGFQVEYFATLENQIYARNGDIIYLYGGDDGDEYDNCRVEVQLPYLDGNKPDNFKSFTALGMACRGLWSVDVAMKPTDIEVVTNMPPQVSGTTYGNGTIPLEGYSTHAAVRLINEAEGYACIGNIALHYAEGETTP